MFRDNVVPLSWLTSAEQSEGKPAVKGRYPAPARTRIRYSDLIDWISSDTAACPSP